MTSLLHATDNTLRPLAYDIDTEVGAFHVEILGDDMHMLGALNEVPDERKISYIAAAPADARTSVTGSGLPFMNKEQAFEGTPNIGEADVTGTGSFTIQLKVPGSYYTGLGTVLVRPLVFIMFKNAGRNVVAHVPVGWPIAYRFNTYPMQYVKGRSSPLFYVGDEGVRPRTQEQIIRASAYPTATQAMPFNFWGSRPPV